MGILDDIRERILVLDGAMGTLLQQGMGEEEALRAYVDAGADIITTNSFNANRISLSSGRIKTIASIRIKKYTKVLCGSVDHNKIITYNNRIDKQ